VDDKANIHAVLWNETSEHMWHTHLDNEIIVASLPMLQQSLPKLDACHHDTGANHHVFHSQDAFETYQAIQPVAVGGFGGDITVAAIGCGTVHMLGRYGDHATPIILQNVLHILAVKSNLISGPSLDEAGIRSSTGDSLITLSTKGVNIVDRVLYQGMYHLNMTIIWPGDILPLTSHIRPPSLLSQISPIVATASADWAGFYTT